MHRNILLPVDLDHESSWRAALPTALGLAAQWQGNLRVLFVIPRFVEQVLPYLPEGVQERARQEAEARLEEFCRQHCPAGAEVTPLVAEGAVYRRILREAQKNPTDVIVMASHRPEMEDYLLGSHAARVVRHAPCSVFIVRE